MVVYLHIVEVKLVLEVGVEERKQQNIGVGELRCQSFGESQNFEHLVSAPSLQFHSPHKLPHCHHQALQRGDTP